MALNNFKFLLLLILLFLVLSVLQAGRRDRAADTSEQGRREKSTKNRMIKYIQLVIILMFSYFCISDLRFAVCVIAETIISYVTALFVDKTDDDKNKQKHRKIIAGGGTAILILMLGYFKYCDFFVNGFRRLFGTDAIALNIMLPIGISFYTFTALGYLIDIYRGKYKAEKNILNYSLYMVFFPKLTAGPIVRGDCFLPQVREYVGIRLKNIEAGVQIFAIGLFKKIVLADRLGVFVDDVFFAPSAYNTFSVVLAVLSYTMQIYFDFSGYSDMAVGISKMLGFDFPRNFNVPYIARGMSDFWSRWHISLSSWFRDYLYIPLGGSRKGKTRTYVNLLIVMTVSGLWHGAGVTFILWGVLHGIASCLSRIVEKGRLKIPAVLRAIVTFLTVSLLWVLFRAESAGNAIEVYEALFTWHDGIMQPYTWSFFAFVVLIIATAVAVWKCKGKEKIEGFYPIMKLDKVWTLTVFFTFVGLTIMLGYFGNTAFIYGKF